jgi:WD40 repeat protein
MRSGHARVYDVARNEELAVVEHTGPVLHAAFSPDGKLIATASTDRTVKVSNARSGAAALATTLYHEDTVSHVSFSGDGSSLATITANGIARVWKLDTQPVTFRHPRGVRSVGFLPDGARLLIATDFEAQIWDSANDGAVLRLPVSSQVYQALLSPDGKQILTGVEAGVAQLWDVADGKEVFAISPRSKRSPSSATLLGSSNSHWTESDFSRSSSAEPCACGMSPIGARSRRFVKVRWMLPHSRRMASAWRWCRNVRP